MAAVEREGVNYKSVKGLTHFPKCSSAACSSTNLTQMLNMDAITPNTGPLTLHHSYFICFYFLLPWTHFVKAEVWILSMDSIPYLNSPVLK